jgi:hypothetical protein
MEGRWSKDIRINRKYVRAIDCPQNLFRSHPRMEEKTQPRNVVDKTLVQVSHFRYLGHDVTLLEETDTDFKIQKLQNICDIIMRTLKGKTQKGCTKNVFPHDSRSCAAIGKRMLGNEKKRQAKIKKNNSRNAIRKVSKGM